MHNLAFIKSISAPRSIDQNLKKVYYFSFINLQEDHLTYQLIFN